MITVESCNVWIRYIWQEWHCQIIIFEVTVIHLCFICTNLWRKCILLSLIVYKHSFIWCRVKQSRQIENIDIMKKKEITHYLHQMTDSCFKRCDMSNVFQYLFEFLFLYKCFVCVFTQLRLIILSIVKIYYILKIVRFSS